MAVRMERIASTRRVVVVQGGVGRRRVGVLQHRVRTRSASDSAVVNAAPQVVSGGLQEVTVKDFHTEVVVASRRQIVVVDCYTDWCGPCKLILPKLVELQAFFDENHARPDDETGDARAVRIVKLNCNSENKAIAKDKLKIKAAPTFKVFVDGDVVESYVGAKIEPLKKLIYKHLGVDEEPEKGTQ